MLIASDILKRGRRTIPVPLSKFNTGTHSHDFFLDLTSGLYVHLPFCKRLCSFCELNMVISNDEKLHNEYITSLHLEIKNNLPLKHKINGLYFGGGSPSFLSIPSFKMLIEGIKETLDLSNLSQFIIEYHPDDLDDEKLLFLKSIGVTELRIGIQDFDSTVLKNVNRNPLQFNFEYAKKLGFKLGADFIVGLPHQNKNSMTSMMEKIKNLPFDFVQFYPLKLSSFGEHNFRLLGSGVHLADSEIVEYLQFIHQELLSVFKPHGFGFYSKENLNTRTLMGFVPDEFKNFYGAGVGSFSRMGNLIKQNPVRLNDYTSAIFAKNTSILSKFKYYSLNDEEILAEILFYEKLKNNAVTNPQIFWSDYI